MKHESIDPKSGAHHTRTDDFRKGRKRKPKKQAPKHLRWRDC